MAITTDGGGKAAGQDAALQQLIAALGSGAGGANAERVFMGRTLQPGIVSPYAPTGATGQKSTESLWMSANDALGDYYNWEPKQQEDFLAKLKVSGLVQADAGPMEAGKLWQALVQEAANYGSKGKEVSPFDLLSRYVKASGDNPWKKSGDGRFEVNALTGERRYVGPQFQTQNQQRIDLTDPATARAIATKMFQDLLGRNPNQGEVGSFAAALQQTEQDNPAQQATTTQYDMTTGEPIATNTVSRGGVSADGKALLAQDQIKGKKEYGAVQAATTYANALENAVYRAPR